MTEIGYTVEANFIERTELTMKPGIMVLTGLNATMKSIAARTFLVAGIKDTASIELYTPNFVELLGSDGKIEFKEDHSKVVSNARKLLVSDSRIALRSILNASESIKRIMDLLREIRRLESNIGGLIDVIESDLSKILKNLGIGFLQEVYTERGKASLSIVSEIYDELDETIKIVANELAEIFIDPESAKSAIMPLSVGIRDPEKLRVDVRDQRFDKTIPVTGVSTSIIAPLLFDLVTAFLSQPVAENMESYCIAVIEEPEESMTPLQQVVFSMYLEKAVEKSIKLTKCTPFIIIVTHSPYIAYAFSDNVQIKYFGYDITKRKIIVEDKPMKTFAMADVILTSRILKATRTGMKN